MTKHATLSGAFRPHGKAASTATFHAWAAFPGSRTTATGLTGPATLTWMLAQKANGATHTGYRRA